MRRINKLVGIVILVLIIITSCSTQKSGMNSSYPSKEEAYPIPNPETGYPIVDNENTKTYKQGPEFAIDEPVKSGNLLVTGTGPAGVPIKLVDVTKAGEFLAETVISSNGNFTFTLSEPISEHHMIGLQLGDLTGTEFNEEDFIYNENYFVRPLVGILFDIVIIQ